MWKGPGRVGVAAGPGGGKSLPFPPVLRKPTHFGSNFCQSRLKTMQRRYALLVALVAMLASSSFLPLGGSMLASWSAFAWAKWLYNLAGTGEFAEVAPDVYRLDLWWCPLPVMLFPLTAVLVKEGPRWVLIDAGAADGWSQSYASHLVAAVKRKLPKKDTLDTILLTHCHFDHTGALPQLLDAYPSAQVVVHEDEAPFLTGSRTYFPPNSAFVSSAQLVGIAPRGLIKVDPGRVSHLHGSSGDLSVFGIHSLTWVGSPGHSPGHVSYLHAPSGILVVGDAFMNAWPSVAMEAGLGSVLTYPLRKFGRGGALLAGLVGSSMLRMLPRALTDFVPVGVQQLINSTLLGGDGDSGAGSVAHEKLMSSGVAMMGGGGDETSEGTVVKGGKVQGQAAGAVKVPYTWGLPKVALRVKPMFICPRPTGDEYLGHKSICKLASLKFRKALPMHDLTGRGLAPGELAAFAASLPACR